jgi:hypothetical protein
MGATPTAAEWARSGDAVVLIDRIVTLMGNLFTIVM